MQSKESIRIQRENEVGAPKAEVANTSNNEKQKGPLAYAPMNLQGMQAESVGPAQGAIMEFVLPEKGKYTFVDHSFANATMGAMGILAAD